MTAWKECPCPANTMRCVHVDDQWVRIQFTPTAKHPQRWLVQYTSPGHGFGFVSDEQERAEQVFYQLAGTLR